MNYIPLTPPQPAIRRCHNALNKFDFDNAARQRQLEFITLKRMWMSAKVKAGIFIISLGRPSYPKRSTVIRVGHSRQQEKSNKCIHFRQEDVFFTGKNFRRKQENSSNEFLNTKLYIFSKDQFTAKNKNPEQK